MSKDKIYITDNDELLRNDNSNKNNNNNNNNNNNSGIEHIHKCQLLSGHFED